MEIGTKVRNKNGGALMTVIRTTPQGYIICEWHDGWRLRQEMFFPKMLMAEPTPPTPGGGIDPSDASSLAGGP
jgi:uncharacterized protein YodC (DUF2158 family)